VGRQALVDLALFSLVTVLALQRSHGGDLPVPVTAWYHKDEATFSDGLPVVRRHLGCARHGVNSAPEADIWQLPREALDLLIHGLPSAA
jgi:hypothetical protein